jgi:serine O-acetyltransferase
MYTNFLYWLSRYLYEENDEELASKVYGLNKMCHAVDLFYAIKLPTIWSCEHPLGSVMGRAEYGDRFFFYQGCTVGGNIHKGTISYPLIGHDVKMYSNSKVLGKSHIGNNVIIAANTYIINQDVPDNSIVFGQSPNIIIKNNIFEF